MSMFRDLPQKILDLLALLYLALARPNLGWRNDSSQVPFSLYSLERLLLISLILIPIVALHLALPTTYRIFTLIFGVLLYFLAIAVHARFEKIVQDIRMGRHYVTPELDYLLRQLRVSAYVCVGSGWFMIYILIE